MHLTGCDEARAVLGDAREERGQGRVPLWLAAARADAYADAYAYADADADAYAYADADAAAYADADAYADAYANADADADADANADADADAYANADADADADAYANANADAYADAYANADADAYAHKITSRELDMRDGLYAVTVAQSGRTVLRVGWFRRDAADPDEYEVAWSTPYRGEYATRLGDVWTKGPSAAPAWTWGPMCESAAHRFHFQPLARLDPEKWAKICPRPAGW